MRPDTHPTYGYIIMEWKNDILGPPFEATEINHTDGASCTVVRLRHSSPAASGILYIHGFSDYFFQAEMARVFYNAGYDFYAVDLRRYGRSLRQGETMFSVERDLSEYFPDIQSGINVMQADGVRHIVLLGHSTGGLTAALYMATGNPSPLITRLVLNSPFLDWNMPYLMRKAAVPVVSMLGRFFPRMKVHQRSDATYARSLARKLGGEWDYNRQWEPDIMPDPDAAWVRAIDRGQRRLMRHASNVKVPVLLLHSDSTARQGDPDEKFRRADAILDVALIAARGRRLGDRVTEVTVSGGLHDLSLSSLPVREFFFRVILDWLA